MQASAYIGADSSLDATCDPAASVVLLPGDNSGASGAADAAAAAAAAVKSGAAESPVLPIVPFEACLNKFTAAEVRRFGSSVIVRQLHTELAVQLLNAARCPGCLRA
jgi:hypothetical protein